MCVRDYDLSKSFNISQTKPKNDSAANSNPKNSNNNNNNTITDNTDEEYNFEDVVQNGVHSFDEMALDDTVLRGIYAFGFEKPSTVQARAIVPAKSGRDIIIQAQSGTGKTGTFSIATLSQLDFKNPNCQAIFLSPTRELASQTNRVLGERDRER